VPWKGQEIFLRALARVAPQVSNLKALIVGDADPPTETTYRERLRALTEQLGLADIVRFTGFCSDISAVMASLDVLVHSSSSPEPFGIVVIEGMAAGKPVIATRAGGVLDIIEDGTNGLLVPIGDEHAMADAILNLAHHRDLAVRLGTRARECVATRFTAAQYAQAVQAIYQNLVHRNGNVKR
jgi:glycosyltransferase involved in cell wall biosynthesis